MKIPDRAAQIEAKIESLQRRRAELLSAAKSSDRKIRTRALIVVGGIIAAEAKSNPAAVNFLLARSKNLSPRDREILSAAFPQIFTATTPVAATAAAENQEPKNA